MARRPKNPHPLRVVRDSTGLNQSKFAQAIQTSSAMVHAIEHRQRNITSELAQRLLGFAGVYPPSLENTSPYALDLSGNVYSAGSFRRWTTRTGTLDSEQKGLIADWLQRVRQLLDAAALENRLSGALFLLEEQLELIASTLSLEQRLQTLRDAGLAVTKTFRVRELRRDRALAKALGFKDSAKLLDEMEVRMRLTPQVRQYEPRPSIRAAILANSKKIKATPKPPPKDSKAELGDVSYRQIGSGPAEVELNAEEILAPTAALRFSEGPHSGPRSTRRKRGARTSKKY
jgi:transcriptional regulator with XRE-family HTH domain